MAIETGPAGSTQGSAVHGAGHGLKNRGKGPDAGAGAFSLLLSGMGSQADQDALASGTADEATEAEGAAAGDPGQDRPGIAPDAACAATAAAPATDTGGTAADGAAGAKGLAGLAGKSGHGAAPGQAATGLVATGAEVTAASEGQVTGTVERFQDPATLTEGPSAESIAELVAGLKAPASSDARPGAALGALQEAATHTPTVGLAMRTDESALAAKATPARVAAFDPAKGALAGLARGAALQADSRDAKSSSLTAPVDNMVSATAQLLAAFDAKDGATPDRGRDKPGSGGQSFTSTLSAVMDPGPASAARTSGDVSFASIAASQQLTPEELMAKQVSVWITQKTQGAQLKLDGFGDQPVEVSISVTGNEAEVMFRSDNAPARAWLENAMPQLKELLQSEGLVLSGASVGTSGKGDADAQAGGRQGRDAQPGAGGKPEPAAPQTGPARAARPLGAVDVFA
ncbi:MAG TPA: flagellar hook-length control protein FliK [Burkholderiaceae bacterium]|nr:flagellar hook-length control protein FliK [Burkholderiaceae bacterium]